MEELFDQTIEDQLKGYLSVTFAKGKNFDEFCEKNFDNYDPDQYEAIAIRAFYGNELVITLYALDKLRQEGTNFDHTKLPVKKFKVTHFSLDKMLAFVKEFNFTLTTGNYLLEDMEVINK